MGSDESQALTLFMELAIFRFSSFHSFLHDLPDESEGSGFILSIQKSQGQSASI